MDIFDQILTARGLRGDVKQQFLSPDYGERHDPFLLPDMDKAVERLRQAHDASEKVTIYGDYDIDGLSATALLLDAFTAFGFKDVEAFIPNRFVDGYGVTIEAVDKINATGTKVIVTVDCGSLSHKEIEHAKTLGVDVVVTDHHSVAETMPPAAAVINPKRPGHTYPFIDLPGVGVAFKLVQGLQKELPGLPAGQEKWLLDLVALGTVCDVVDLLDENRTHVYWGLKVMQKTRRAGLKALMAVARIEPQTLNARSLGFGLGPRMNAAGRLETALYSLEVLTATDGMAALSSAQKLDTLNATRRRDQDEIFKVAVQQAEEYASDPVLVVSHPAWNHGIIGIVAAKLLERYKKPTFVLQEMGMESKGSARSYGDFSAVEAINASRDIITKGGGHKLAAGVTLPTANIAAFRGRVNDFYHSIALRNQQDLLLPRADVTVERFDQIDEPLLEKLKQLEPYGNGNPEPIFRAENVLVTSMRRMGSDGQHVDLRLRDTASKEMKFVAFSCDPRFFVEPGEYLTIWFLPLLNEWRGKTSIEGRLLHLEPFENVA